MTNDGSGLSLQGSYASYDPDTRLWRTYQGSLFGGLEMFSGTWPNSGTMRNGAVYQRPQWVPPISESESSLWPTPTATSNGPGKDPNNPRGIHQGNALATAVMWPTPTAMTGGEGVAPSYKNGKHGWNTAAAVHDSMNEKPTRMWPTPRASSHQNPVEHGRGGRDLVTEVYVRETGKVPTTGQLNPTWVEWLMGFPLGWTDLEP